ncbi:hypothetical protein KM043_002667 [Ampulex compressa]|nr:hypothetical protein KM043_002667 [Ampulex compressa]
MTMLQVSTMFRSEAKPREGERWGMGERMPRVATGKGEIAQRVTRKKLRRRQTKSDDRRTEPELVIAAEGWSRAQPLPFLLHEGASMRRGGG